MTQPITDGGDLTLAEHTNFLCRWCPYHAVCLRLSLLSNHSAPIHSGDLALFKAPTPRLADRSGCSSS